jgi:putative addiction module component (TIGR02574 family)
VVNQALLKQVKQLAPAERLELIGELWQSLNPDEFQVTDAEAAMLDERVARLAANPSSGRAWHEVEAGLRHRLP